VALLIAYLPRAFQKHQQPTNKAKQRWLHSLEVCVRSEERINRFAMVIATVVIIVLCKAEGIGAELTFSAITVSGITPRARVAFFGITHTPEGYETRYDRIATIVDDHDGDGAVTYSMEPQVPLRSVWSVIDLQSGDYVTSAPVKSPAKHRPLPEEALAGNGGQLQRIVRHAEFANVLVARPGVGAWVLSAGDGGEGDEDGVFDGRITNSLTQLKPVASSGPPPHTLIPTIVLLHYCYRDR
jgi:hypothetical protein